MSITDNLTLGSLFDGIGGFPYAASFYGIKTLWASEILPSAISVTKRHFPQMKHIGDITQLHGGQMEAVDIISFGSPCQGLSLAGKRQGFADERSGLFSEAIRIIHEMQEVTNGQYPKIAIWENVPGALSSDRGRDFKAVLEAFTETEIPMPLFGHWSNAGMVRSSSVDLAWIIYDAQYFGTAQRRRRIFLVADFTGRRAAEILFVGKSLHGYFAAGGTPRQGAATYASKGTYNHVTVLNDQGGESLNVEKSDKSPTLRSQTHGNLPIIADLSTVYCLQGNMIGRKEENGPKGSGVLKNACFTLTATDVAAVAVDCRKGYVVRRLTPTECERLQGYPDGWTADGHDGRPISDSKRYQMLGNSVAVPCVAYIMAGIVTALKEEEEINYALCIRAKGLNQG